MNTENKIHILRWEELPDFPLYIDQVVGLIEKSLSFLMTDKEDKIVTSTMINNYVKHEIVQAPEKKKYTRDQVAYFTIICLLKKVYSLEDISKLIQIQFEQSNIYEAYNHFCDTFESLMEDFYHHPENINELFLKTIMSVVYTVYVQNEIREKPTQKDIKRKQKH